MQECVGAHCGEAVLSMPGSTAAQEAASGCEAAEAVGSSLLVGVTLPTTALSAVMAVLRGVQELVLHRAAVRLLGRECLESGVSVGLIFEDMPASASPTGSPGRARGESVDGMASADRRAGIDIVAATLLLRGIVLVPEGRPVPVNFHWLTSLRPTLRPRS